MSAQDLPYFKFVQALIDAGLWAKMSSAARTLYPVLLRFSDRHFSAVYPGSNRLLQLTGFKQKSSLRKAREELISLGLISTTPGTGRSNTVYHFRFDWATPREAQEHAPGRGETLPRGSQPAIPEAAASASPYNQIHISINNKPEILATGSLKDTATDVWQPLNERYGGDTVQRVRNELDLAGLSSGPDDVQKILSGSSASAGMSSGESWQSLRDFLSERISPMSLEQLDRALLREGEGVLVFKSTLPEHLKHLLGRVAPHVCFEPGMGSLRREIWYQAGNNG
ncbi:MAG: hypothetical protein F9K24_09565 [Leptonema illini]|uniref:Helix-turn-helix domain-containing protein n=1 Tax=Leptonema illini TaxID=183 RepID=A0A833H1R1_9LEPT|nr:MAG: hypothetical protein F9K24_09565 [Leptonema illini]